VNCQVRDADKYLARPTSRCILFDGENMSFDDSLVIYMYIYIQGVSQKVMKYIFFKKIY